MDKSPTNQKVNNQPVIVKKVIKIRRKRSLIGFLSATVFLLAVFIVIGSIIFAAIWLHTYRVFTQEQIVADIYISKETIIDGRPTFIVKYSPKNDVSGFWGIFGSDARSMDKEVEFQMTGDQVFFDADYIRWNDWVTFINFKPVYKVYRVKSDFRDSELNKRFTRDVNDMNGGSDSFAKRLSSKPDKYRWLAQSVFISSAGINVQNEDKHYQLKATEDALVIEAVK